MRACAGRADTVTKLNVPYAEKDEARRLGARWDAERKTWYVPSGLLLTVFERWLPKFDMKAVRGKRRPRKRRAK
jgi:hypothetical protein